MDVLTCKQLMGGDGYYGDDHIDGIPDVIVIGESPDSLPDTERDETENPNDPQDKDWKDDLDNDGSDNDNDSDNGLEKNNEKSSFDKEKMQKNAQCQLGSCCVFAAVNALLCGFGKNNPAGWLGIAITYASNNNIDINDVIGNGFMGFDKVQLDDFVNNFFNTSSIDGIPDSLSNALEDGPVLGIMNPGDVDGNGISDDGHAVIITDFDAENGTVYYWDPETGDMDNGSVGDFLGGWGINGTKE